MRGLDAKPIVDILVEVSSLDETKKLVVPVMESEGYDYFWRPSLNNPDEFYAWFIKRNSDGVRTHHIHMVEKNSILWDGLYFRDYLIEFPDEASRYGKLKMDLAEKFPNDRIAYHEGKSEFVVAITEKAKKYYGVR